MVLAVKRILLLAILLQIGTLCKGHIDSLILLVYKDGKASQRILSDGTDLVAFHHDEIGQLEDCDARLGNQTLAKFVFQEAFLSRTEFQTKVDYDIKRLARQCKRFLRKMLRKDPDDPDPLIRRIKQRQTLQLGYPGTSWCGVYSPGEGQTVAAKRSTDKCCKNLHACSDVIRPYEIAWGQFNRWGWPLFHCKCLDLFKTCLKGTGKTSTDEVGHAFFDVLRPKCFSVEKRKTCVKWDKWFTACQNEKEDDRAVLVPGPHYDVAQSKNT